MAKRLLTGLITVIFMAAIWTGCAPQGQEAKIEGTKAQITPSKIALSGQSISRDEMRALFPGKYIWLSDISYAPFNPDYAPKLHDEFESQLSRLGLTPKWREQFDCDGFAMLKAAIGQTLYAVHSFHENKPAQSVALGEVWYLMGDGRGGHAINLVVQREGQNLTVRFIDIYTGKYMELSEIERATIFFVRF